MNVTQKIKQLAESRGWTEYRLVKESGLASSTIANIYHRNTIPSIPTLEILCRAFGITLSQFFSEDDMVALSPEQAQLLEHWAVITPEQRSILIKLLKTLN
ncbi:MAG: helix-turn-helix domain-containing protein [bacterium]